jgi:hypothetical protein
MRDELLGYSGRADRLRLSTPVWADLIRQSGGKVE